MVLRTAILVTAITTTGYTGTAYSVDSKRLYRDDQSDGCVMAYTYQFKQKQLEWRYVNLLHLVTIEIKKKTFFLKFSNGESLKLRKNQHPNGELEDLLDRYKKCNDYP